MKRLFLLCFIVSVLGSTALADKMRVVTVEVVAPSENRAFKYEGAGLVGAIAGVRTTEQVFAVNTIIENEHARFTCMENHRGCAALGPGTYRGELKGNDLWLTIKVPLQDKLIRDHWKLVGSW
jgi:hypothetical protein